MPDIDRYFDAIDQARFLRARELSDLKSCYALLERNGQKIIGAKACIVLCYANWEGFFNECVDQYVDYLTVAERRVAQVSWSMLAGSLNDLIDGLRDRNHSLEGRSIFVNALRSRLACRFDEFDKKFVKAQSNLNFERVQNSFAILGFDVASLQRFRIRIDRELVAWRHSIAHGEVISLNDVLVDEHVDFVGEILLLISDIFQNALLRVMRNRNTRMLDPLTESP